MLTYTPIKSIFILLLLCYILPIKAQQEEKLIRNKITVSGMLTSSDTWQIDASYHYMICHNIGIGASIGMWKQISVEGLPKGEGWKLYEKNEKLENFYIRPSIYLTSPKIVRLSECGINLFIEPGFMMNLPYNKVLILSQDKRGITHDLKELKSHNGRWYAFDCKAGLSLDFGEGGFSVGYIYSSLDIFAMRRCMEYGNKSFNDFYPSKKPLHGGYISVYYAF